MQQEKLLQAHYADAVPLELMKSEQKRISAELEAIDRQLSSAHHGHALVVANLEAALEFTTQVGAACQTANDKTRRQMNQAILKRVEIGEDGITALSFTELFETMLDPDFLRDAVQSSSLTADRATAEVGRREEGLTLEDVDRLWEMVVRQYEQTPDAAVGGLKERRLVPPVGFEPTTNGLKVHCANQTAPRRRSDGTGARAASVGSNGA